MRKFFQILNSALFKAEDFSSIMTLQIDEKKSLNTKTKEIYKDKRYIYKFTIVVDHMQWFIMVFTS